jgi:hypothetical protein
MFEDVKIEQTAFHVTPASDYFERKSLADIKPGDLISNGMMAVWVESFPMSVLGNIPISVVANSSAEEYQQTRFRFTYRIADVDTRGLFIRFRHPSNSRILMSESYAHDATFTTFWAA